MKFYQNMHPVKRSLMILEAVRGSVSLEGMQGAAKECQKKIRHLRKKNPTLIPLRNSNNTSG